MPSGDFHYCKIYYFGTLPAPPWVFTTALYHFPSIISFAQVERFKELELERYKLLERDRVNKDFNRKLSDYESEYRQRMEGLQQRELESARILDKMVIWLAAEICYF